MKKLLIAVFLCLVSSGSAFAERVLVITNSGVSFDKSYEGLQSEGEYSDWSFSRLVVSNETKSKDIKVEINRYQPDYLVLFGNNAIRFYSKYQKSYPSFSIPAVIAHATFVERFKKLKNTAAIRYELNYVDLISPIKTISKNDIKKIGVLYREWMQDSFDRNENLVLSTGINVIGYSLPNKPKSMGKEVKKGIDSLVKQDVDGILMLTDNAILNSGAIRVGWYPGLRNFDGFTVGSSEAFASTRIPLADISISPDHFALGEQAKNILEGIRSGDIDVSSENKFFDVKRSYNMLNKTLLDKKNYLYDEVILDIVFDKIVTE